MIRVMQSSDIASGLRLCRMSRWNQLEEDWQAFLHSPEGGGRIAESGGNAVGTVAFLRYGRSFSWLSMMLVDPAMRGRGIGARLTEAALEALAAEVCVRLDATPLGEPLYRRFGFAGEFELVRAKAVAPAGSIQTTGLNVAPMAEGDLAQVFASDLAGFGADRSALLASFYRRAPRLAWTVRDGQTLRGYCFGRPGYLYHQVGPVVAGDVETAESLVRRCLAQRPHDTLAVDVPRASGEWLDRLSALGFTIERPFLRMRRGAMQPAADSATQFAIAGPEFG